jgi:hypothetical protein
VAGKNVIALDEKDCSFWDSFKNGFSLEARVVITSPSPNSEKASLIYRGHLCRFLLPLLYIVLYNAERIYSQVLYTKLASDIDGVSIALREFGGRDTRVVRSFGELGCFERSNRAMGQSGVSMLRNESVWKY